MPTTKKRINLTVEEELFDELNRLSEKMHKPISTVSRELIQKALELEEDLYFSRIGDQRFEEAAERVSHDSAWGDV